ncbi:MAG TPA: hypothetical protein VIL52_05685 [Bacteroidota bacterium]
MKKEYDFSTAKRGRFFHSNTKLNLPIYLDRDIAKVVHLVARKKKTDAQTVVNNMLRKNKQAMQALK